METTKLVEGPIKKSTNSVFDGINKYAEAVDLLRKYKKANDELVRSSVEHVQILGMTEPVKLDDIYSVTRISTTIHRRLYGSEWIEIASKHAINSKRYKSTERADKYIDTHDRVVILAGPGSGKTTLLKYTALSYINDDIFSKSALKIRKVPFFVSLPDLLATDSSLEEYLSDKLKIKTHEYASYYVKRLLNKGKAAVLLDSLDEIPPSRRAPAYELIEELSALYPKAKIVITCRVADYDRTLEGFFEVEIARLTENAINRIIRAWFKGKPKKARELINHLSVDKDVYSLTETPLLLSLLCIQYANDLNIPNRKTELYSRCIDAFLRSWDTSRGFRRDTAFSALTDDRKERLFSEIAYEFLCKRGGKYIFSEFELIASIGNFIERFGISQDHSNDILSEIESHHGILEKYSAESFTFSHVSFQEYFVAAALVSKRLELSFVKKSLSNARLESVIIFMVAIMDDPSPVLVYLMEKSRLKGIKTYPAMRTRTVVLSLLYRCMNSGVAVTPKLRNAIYEHIAESQIDISKIYRDANTFPIAKLEDDGISHTYFYRDKTRKTLSDALLSYRKLSNEILLSPNEEYARVAIREIGKMNKQGSVIEDICVRSCLLVPLSGTCPEKVLEELDALNSSLNDDDVFFRITKGTTDKIRANYVGHS